MNEPHTSAINVKFVGRVCTYVHWTVCSSQLS